MSQADFYVDTVCDDVSGFDSGHKVFNDYLFLKYDDAVIHYILDAESTKLIAYFALISSALPFIIGDFYGFSTTLFFFNG